MQVFKAFLFFAKFSFESFCYFLVKIFQKFIVKIVSLEFEFAVLNEILYNLVHVERFTKTGQSNSKIYKMHCLDLNIPLILYLNYFFLVYLVLVGCEVWLFYFLF